MRGFSRKMLLILDKYPEAMVHAHPLFHTGPLVLLYSPALNPCFVHSEHQLQLHKSMSQYSWNAFKQPKAVQLPSVSASCSTLSRFSLSLLTLSGVLLSRLRIKSLWAHAWRVEVPSTVPRLSQQPNSFTSAAEINLHTWRINIIHTSQSRCLTSTLRATK